MKTHLTTPIILRYCAACFVLGGILMFGSVPKLAMQASVSSQGSTVLELNRGAPAKKQETTIAAAPTVDVQSSAGGELELRLALGMIFMLAGFGFYVISVIHSRPVRRSKNVRKRTIKRPAVKFMRAYRTRTA